MPLLSEAIGLVRLASGLRPFARQRLDPDEARRLVRERMQTREDRFLEILDRAVWPRRDNPFRRLLAHAGASADDVRALVRREGLEGALARLHALGVFVTWEELKGRDVARRGSRTFHFRERDFDNPLTRTHYMGTSGGSLAAPVRVKVSPSRSNRRRTSRCGSPSRGGRIVRSSSGLPRIQGSRIAT